MIKYRPNRNTLSLSIKEEQIFDTMEDLLHFVYEHLKRVFAFIESEEPVFPEHIIVGDEGHDDPLIGWKNERTVSLVRYHSTQTVGFCGE